jgi:hypothetical protein
MDRAGSLASADDVSVVSNASARDDSLSKDIFMMQISPGQSSG